MELHEGLGLAVVLACPLHNAPQPAAVLGVDDDHDVAALHRLRDQCRQRDALARLGGADQQRAALEILQRPVQRHFPWLDAVDVRQADFGVGLWVAVVPQPAQQAGRDGEFAVVHLGQFVEPLRVDRPPFEAETQEHIGGVLAPAGQRGGTHDLDAPAAEGRTQDQNIHRLRDAQQAHHEAEQGQRRGKGDRQPASRTDDREERHGQCPDRARIQLVGAAPRHFVAAHQHVRLTPRRVG